jgi:hypothetical protein
MKTNTIINLILAYVTGICLAQEAKFSVTKEKLPRADGFVENGGQPDAEFRIKMLDADQSLPDLTIPAYSYGSRTRIVDVRTSQKSAAIAIQDDEFGIDYYDYLLANGRWILQHKKRVCELSGALALSLAQVDILEGGAVEIKYHHLGQSDLGKSGWEQELIKKDHKGKDKLLVERYELKDGAFVLVGGPARGLRPQVQKDPTPQEKRNNKGADDKPPTDPQSPR